MIKSVLDVAGFRRHAFSIASALVMLLALPAASFAQEPRVVPRVVPPAAAPAAPDAITPIDEYARQVDELKRAYPELNKRIQDAAKTIDDLTDADKGRKEIEQLRGVVADMLGAVTDNGAVAQLGAKALTHARDKLKTLETESRFTPEERQVLLDTWRKLIVETERATSDLDTARKEFAELLRTLQTREDFIDELLQVRRASEAIRVIHELSREIREASDKLKTLIGGIKAPGV